MLVMRTTERPAYPLGKLVGSEEPVRLYDLALAMNPLRLYGVQPRAPLRKQAADDPHPFSALLDAAVVPPEPSPDLLGDVPRGVVPDEQQNFLAHLFELLQAPLEKLSRYGRNRSSVYEAQPHVADLGQVEPVAAYGLRSFAGIVSCDRPLDKAQRVALLAPGVERGKRQAAPPAFVLEAYRPGFGVLGGHFHQSVAPPFFRSYRGSGEVIHRLARIPRVHRLVSYPNSLGERWSMPRNFSALFSSKASRVRLGREDLAWRARRPLRLKSWMASRTVWEAHPRFEAIFGARSPLALAKSTCERRMAKASLERSPFSRLSRSFSDNGRTKIGVFMDGIVTRQPKPILKMH